jgi:WD40 repeat protein
VNTCKTGHADSVECVKWGGEGLLYSASRDRTIMVWSVKDEGMKLYTSKSISIYNTLHACSYMHTQYSASRDRTIMVWSVKDEGMLLVLYVLISIQITVV